jgi:hypothetical protein
MVFFVELEYQSGNIDVRVLDGRFFLFSKSRVISDLNLMREDKSVRLVAENFNCYLNHLNKLLTFLSNLMERGKKIH